VGFSSPWRLGDEDRALGSPAIFKHRDHRRRAGSVRINLIRGRSAPVRMTIRESRCAAEPSPTDRQGVGLLSRKVTGEANSPWKTSNRAKPACFLVIGCRGHPCPGKRETPGGFRICGVGGGRAGAGAVNLLLFTVTGVVARPYALKCGICLN